MTDNPIRVLLVEDGPADANRIWEMLAEAGSTAFDLECVEWLSTAIERLAAGGIDVVLLDLWLPDSQGLETLAKMRPQASGIPIIVLTSIRDGELAAHALREGAQDYLVKGSLDGDMLVRAISYALDRKRADERLRESEQKLAGIVESVTDAMIMLDEQFNIVWTNDAAKDFFGADIIGKKCYAACHGCDKVCEPCIPKQCFEDGKVYEFETEMTAANGNQLSFWCTGSTAAWHEDGRPKMVVECLRNITDRRRAEEELKELTYDLSKRVRELNCLYSISKQVEKAGISSEEILQGIVDLVPSSWQCPEIACARIISQGQEFTTDNFTESIWKQVSDIVVKDECVGAVEVFYLEEKPERDEGPFLKEERCLIDAIAEKLAYFIERRRMEKEILSLARLPGENPNPVIRVTKDSTILYANDASLPLLSAWRCQVGQRLPDKWRRLTADVFSFGSSLNTKVEFGDSVLSLTFAPVVDTGHVNLYGFDVTERTRIEQLLKEREKQLFQSQKMEALGTLVTGVAHEINNPVSLIMFNVPLLKDIWQDIQPVLEEQVGHEPNRKYGGLKYEYLRKRLSQLLEDMDLASDRIARTVSGLKNFARQSDVADKRPMLVNEAVENAIQLSQTSLRKAEIRMVVHLGDDLPSMEGNLQGVEQIILNLIVNAVEAIDHKRGTIEITSEFEETKEQIFVSISDNGSGIDSAISDKIFDPFVTSRIGEGGTGLGLSITHNLVRAHDGEITFRSEKGKGTTFTITFPTALREKRAKILVVDDDRKIRVSLTEALTTVSPYLVDEAPNGVEACIKLWTYRPDLIILDLFMPEMDGLEVCRNIRREPELSDIKVMVMTEFPNHPKVKEVAELDFRNMCFKPFIIRDFVKRVDELLRGSS